MDNPFQYSAPVEDPKGFFGRASELTRIASRIAAERPQSVAVVGPALTGKSSLVNYLFDPDVQAEYLEDPSACVMVRLRLRYDTPGNPKDFFRRLAGALAFVGVEGMMADYDGFSEVARRLMGEGRRMVVFLDDFEAVTGNAGFPLDFFSYMRSIANSNDVAYLTTSAAPLQNLCHTQDIEESPFFNIFTTVNLEPLKDREARQLVCAPAAAAGVALDDDVDTILDLAGRHPYVLQLTAGLAFDMRTAGRPVDARELRRRAFDAARDYLERMWRGLSEAQRQVLIALSGGQPVDRRHQYAVESLEQLGLVHTNGGAPDFALGLAKPFAELQGPKRGFLRRLFG